MVKIILKIPAALRRDDDEPKRRTVYVPRKPRSERKWKKNNKIITEERRSVIIFGEVVREKIERIKYSRDYSFLFPVLDDDHHHYQPPLLVVPLIKKLKEASESKVIKTSSTSDDHDQLGLLKDDRKVEDNNHEGFRQRIEEKERLKLMKMRSYSYSCMPRRKPKISLGGPRLVIK
ncbi:hypothetical protein EZV62_007167 [Acer yangbiense]|uniref:Uncharacterized protein n=1 Tax=Acer yangbiense TaxID=1000413 RepID=A0A5C7IB26_9ROSI|nr:hypothetical protein EZV62_007167 [Acer yangbiense]